YPTSYWVYDLDCVLPCFPSPSDLNKDAGNQSLFAYFLLGIRFGLRSSMPSFMYLRALCCSSWLQVVRSCTIERSRQEQCQVQIWCMTEQSLFELRLDSQLQTSKKFQGLFCLDQC
ncbi:unnamed protein product, partial [Linum tenue]